MGTLDTTNYINPEHLFPEGFDFTSTQPVAWITVQGHDPNPARYDYDFPGVFSGTGIVPNPDADGFRRVKDVSVCFFP
jgi:hypothetical protein